MSENKNDAEETPTKTEPVHEPKEAVEDVETIAGALKRLANGAGKDRFDVCSVRDDRGFAFDGTVFTEVRYPFGLSVNTGAAMLKSVLGQLNKPTVKTTDKFLTLTESGKRFQLRKMPAEALETDRDPPEATTEAIGSWWRRLLPTLPTKAGYNRFPGVWAGPEGYVGSDGVVLGYIKVSGPEEATIIPRQMLEVLPSTKVTLHTDRNMIVAETPETTWSCPALEGNYPGWQAILLPPDRTAVVQLRALTDALKAVAIVDRFANLVIKDDGSPGLVKSAQIGASIVDDPSDAKAEFSVERCDGDITITVDVRKFLNVLDQCVGTTLLLGATDQMDRLIFKPQEMQPETQYVMAHVRGTSQVGE